MGFFDAIFGPKGTPQEVKDALTRWDEFLVKINARYDEVVAEVESGMMDLLDQSKMDPTPLINAWNGVSTKLDELRTKIENTWEEKVRTVIDKALEDGKLDGSSKEFDDLLAKKRKAMDDLEARLEKSGMEVMARAAKKVMEVAREELKNEHKCTQCGAVLEIPENVFQSSNVACKACNQVNTFEPGAKVRAIEDFCARPMAQEKSMKEFEELQKVRNEDIRMDDTKYGEYLDRWEQAEKNYANAYYNARAEIVSRYKDSIQKDIDMHMQNVLQTINSHRMSFKAAESMGALGGF